MSTVTGSNVEDPAETIVQAIHVASSMMSLQRSADGCNEIHADQSEGLRLISAFVQIEDVAVRAMFVDVAEILAETRRAALDA